ncbi:MAG: hypothetical protein PHO07_16920 [Pirellulales bacterium]|nr:hypothetical protein [Thermoguttaceae bacterium]MDD4788856.1 hypothetical protein [Pirellulales bacterium]MDI9445336.1 hypothetical protein [Planctomycetota bacterium]
MIARYTMVLVAGMAALLSAQSAAAGGKVQLELVADERVPITGQQEWLARLARAGIEGFRIRARNPSDQPRIDVGGSDDAPVYSVVGVLTANDELLLPGARFRAAQVGGLAEWLRDLAEQGPPDRRPATGAFGLTENDFALLHADMAPALGFDTQGMSRADVIRVAARQMSTPLVADPELAEPLGADKVAENLAGLSRGTALAYVVRPHGLGIVPQPSGGRIGLAILEAKPETQVWPIGWEPKRPEKDVKPEMFEFLEVNVTGVSVTQVLEAVSQRLKMPILLDQNALARHGLEPDKVFVAFPHARTTYSIMLRRALFKAMLKGELRVDEADRPFLWVTSIKPI